MISERALRATPRKGYAIKTICGRVLQLKIGETYVAQAPLSSFGAFATDPITVTIYRKTNLFGSAPVACVNNLTQEGAWAFLGAFNNGRISFLGREWGK